MFSFKSFWSLSEESRLVITYNQLESDYFEHILLKHLAWISGINLLRGLILKKLYEGTDKCE